MNKEMKSHGEHIEKTMNFIFICVPHVSIAFIYTVFIKRVLESPVCGFDQNILAQNSIFQNADEFMCINITKANVILVLEKIWPTSKI